MARLVLVPLLIGAIYIQMAVRFVNLAVCQLLSWFSPRSNPACLAGPGVPEVRLAILHLFIVLLHLYLSMEYDSIYSSSV